MDTEPISPSRDEPLPGLGDPDTSRPSELVRQVRRSLQAMADQGMVDDRHAGLMQLALDLAAAIRPGEKAYGVAQAGAQLLATFERLMPAEEGGTPDGIRELRAFLDGVESAGSSATLRNPS